MTDLRDLAERVEGLTGPDRETDYLIENALGLAKFKREPDTLIGDSDYLRVEPKRYTASVDAAMALVPKGCRTRIDRNEDGRGAAWAGLPWRPPTWLKLCSSPAIAIVAAALRAHAEQPGQHGEMGDG